MEKIYDWVESYFNGQDFLIDIKIERITKELLFFDSKSRPEKLNTLIEELIEALKSEKYYFQDYFTDNVFQKSCFYTNITNCIEENLSNNWHIILNEVKTNKPFNYNRTIELSFNKLVNENESDLIELVSGENLFFFNASCLEYCLKEKDKLINPSKINKPTTNALKWYGKQIELIELTKVLIENGNLKGKQEDIFIAIQETFNIELNNIDQAITKFNARNQENETKFLDTLKGSLSKYIKTKIEKNH